MEQGIERAQDLSRDFAVACRLLEDGGDDHTIAATIAVQLLLPPPSARICNALASG